VSLVDCAQAYTSRLSLARIYSFFYGLNKSFIHGKARSRAGARLLQHLSIVVYSSFEVRIMIHQRTKHRHVSRQTGPFLSLEAERCALHWWSKSESFAKCTAGLRYSSSWCLWRDVNQWIVVQHLEILRTFCNVMISCAYMQSELVWVCEVHSILDCALLHM